MNLLHLQCPRNPFFPIDEASRLSSADSFWAAQIRFSSAFLTYSWEFWPSFNSIKCMTNNNDDVAPLKM